MFEGDKLVPPCWGVDDDGRRPGCTKKIPSPAVPYCENCPPGRTLTYDHCKKHPHIVNVSALVHYASGQAANGHIDALTNLRDTPVYLYRGTKDTCYLKGAVQNTADFFEALGSRVRFNNTTPSAHAWPTRDYGPPCGKGVIEDCHYDGPGAALTHIYGDDLHPPTQAVAKNLFEFDQSPFMTANNNGTDHYNESMPHVTGLAPAGMVYVPSGCVGGAEACRVHFSLHGCGVNGYYDEAVQHLGFQDWGESNNIAIVFPRIQPHGGTVETMSGCWDGYAQSGADYALKSGAQMHAVRQMIAAIGGPPL